MLEFPQGSILSPTLFLLYSKDLLDNVICNITIYADDTTLYSKCDQASDLTQQLGLASELEYDLVQDILDRYRKRLVNFNARRCFKCSFQCLLTDLITIVLLIWKWMSLFLRKDQLLRYWGCLSFSSKLDWGSCIVSLAKTVFKKLEPWIILWSFFLLMLFCISIYLPYDLSWNTAVMSGLVLLADT